MMDDKRKAEIRERLEKWRTAAPTDERMDALCGDIRTLLSHVEALEADNARLRHDALEGFDDKPAWERVKAAFERNAGNDDADVALVWMAKFERGVARHAEELAKRDAEIARLQAELEALKKKFLTSPARSGRVER